MSESNQHTVCIIGGGMSGLFTGALLAKNGYKVTILEKNHIIGGGLQSFRRGDAVFNTGLQAFAGYEKDMISYQFFKYLGINQTLKILPTESNAQEIFWFDKQRCFHLPKGKQAYTDYLIRHFPHEEKGIRQLMEIVFQIGHTFDYLFLNSIQRHEEHIPYAYMPAYELIRQYVEDERLIMLFSYIGGTTGHCLEKMPTLEFCMMLTLYVTGSHRFMGGSKQLVDALRNVIKSNEGEIVNNTNICKVIIENRRVECVLSVGGKQWKADTYIWACSPQILVNIANDRVFRLSMEERVNTYVNPFSCYVVYCKMKEKAFSFINSLVYIAKPNPYKNLPQAIFFVTQPTCENQEWAETMDIYIPTSYEEVSVWSDTTIEKRGKEYNDLKLRIAQENIKLIAKYYPEIEDAIETFYVGSPLTIRDYYGNPSGAVYGQHGLYTPIRTRVSNLFMTGQAIQNQGIAGIATVATLTAETIMEQSLIDKIAKA